MKQTFFTPLFTAFCILVAAGPLWAHAHLESTEPQNAANVQTSPAVISLRFGSAVELALSKIIVTDGNNQPIPTTPPESSDDDESLSVKPTSELKPGNYRVRWNALSRDGHPVSGEFAFTVSK